MLSNNQLTKYIQPPFLKKNDMISIVSPAGQIDRETIDNATKIMQECGLQIEIGQYVCENFMGFAGSDEQRRDDLQAAINNPDTKAIICSRGGYGCGRIIDEIDFTPLQKNPKWLVGFSDITVLHARLFRLGIQSIHGAMPKNFSNYPENNESLKTLYQALFGELCEYEIASHKLNKNGQAKGKLVGGNLSLIANLAATPDDIDTTDAILFIEDVGEFLYNIDRMLNNLQRSGKLNKLKGLIVGNFSNTKNDSFIFDKTAYEIISSYVENLNIPVCFGFPAGHEEPNYALYFGREITLDINKISTKIIF